MMLVVPRVTTTKPTWPTQYAIESGKMAAFADTNMAFVLSCYAIGMPKGKKEAFEGQNIAGSIITLAPVCIVLRLSCKHAWRNGSSGTF